MLNKIALMGRLTRDPELRHTQDNTPVASFTLAVDRTFNREQTDFIDIVAWRKQAEFVSQYFRKGMLVAVSGRLQIRNWKDKDDNNRRSAEVVAEEVYFAEPKRSSSYDDDGSYRGAPAPMGSGGPKADESGFSEIMDEDEELPF